MTTLVSPTPALDWRILPNVVIGGQGNGKADYQHFWLTIKQILCNQYGSGTWLKMDGTSGSDPTACGVILSCNSTTAPTSYSDTTDRWTSLASVVNPPGGTSPYSWIALSIPGISANAQLMLAIENGNSSFTYLSSGADNGSQPSSGNNNLGGVFFSQLVGFNTSGGIGTTSRRAYATDEVQIFNRRNYTNDVTYLGNLSNSSTSGDWNGKLHVMRTADGANTRMVYCQNGVPIWYFFLGVPSSPYHTNASPDHTWNADDIPWYGAVYGSSTVVSAGLYNGTPAWMTAVNFASRVSSNTNPTTKAVTALYPACLWSAAMGDILIAANNTVSNLGDGGYMPLPIGLASNASGYVQPYAGTIDDLFFIGNNLTDGASGADNGSTHSWRKFGNFLMPYAHGVSAAMS